MKVWDCEGQQTEIVKHSHSKISSPSFLKIFRKDYVARTIKRVLIQSPLKNTALNCFILTSYTFSCLNNLFLLNQNSFNRRGNEPGEMYKTLCLHFNLLLQKIKRQQKEKRLMQGRLLSVKEKCGKRVSDGKNYCWIQRGGIVVCRDVS